MLAGNSKGEHFSVVRSGAFSTPDLDVGGSLVGVGVVLVVDKLELRVYPRGSPDMMNTGSSATISLGSIAEIDVITQALRASAIAYLIIAVVDVPNEIQAALFVGGWDGVNVKGNSGVFGETGGVGSVEGGELEHPLTLGVVSSGELFQRGEVAFRGVIVWQGSQRGYWSVASVGSFLPVVGESLKDRRRGGDT